MYSFSENSGGKLPKQEALDFQFLLQKSLLLFLWYIPKITRMLLSVVLISECEYEPVTCGMPYNFIVLNSLVTGHLGKMIISPNWWNQFWWNMWCWNRDMWGYLSEKFQTQKRINFRDITKTVIGISAEESGKLGLPVLGASLHCFSEKECIGKIHLKIYIFISNKIWNIPSFEN